MNLDTLRNELHDARLADFMGIFCFAYLLVIQLKILSKPTSIFPVITDR